MSGPSPLKTLHPNRMPSHPILLMSIESTHRPPVLHFFPLFSSQRHTLAPNCQLQFAYHKVLHHRPRVARPCDSMSQWGLGVVLCCAGSDTRSSNSSFLSQSVATQEDVMTTPAAQELCTGDFPPLITLAANPFPNLPHCTFMLPRFFFRAHPPAHPCPCQPGSLPIFLASMPLTC